MGIFSIYLTKQACIRDRRMDSNKGLCCFYFMHPVEKTAYISLRLSELPVEKVVQNFAISLSNKGKFQLPSGVSEETLMKIVRSMDREYDKQCAKMLLYKSVTSS